MKTKLLLENFGLSVRASLTHGQDEIAKNMFHNLAWACHHYHVRHEIESFTTSWNKLGKAIHAFRCANVVQARRSNGGLKQHPFELVIMPQTNNIANISPHAMGCYQDNPEEIVNERILQAGISKIGKYYAEKLS
mgnify:CR=1 FL=1